MDAVMIMVSKMSDHKMIVGFRRLSLSSSRGPEARANPPRSSPLNLDMSCVHEQEGLELTSLLFRH